MITAYELKNRPCCRFFYKIPYFIKNLALLILLCAIMLPIYFAHFRKESLGYSSVYKLLMGLNSKTFNYLQANSEDALNLRPELKTLEAVGLNLKKFYTQCVSYSRTCKLKDVAKTWPALEKWRYQKDGYKYLAKKIGGHSTTVYVDEDATNEEDNFSAFSFKTDSVEIMKFTEFLGKMASNAVGMTMRDSTTSLMHQLESDIVAPEFYHEYGEFENLEVTMGQFFLDNAHYDRTDQILCAVDGSVKVALVPPVYRQEMQPGSTTTYHHEIKGHEMIVELDVNESPINLFKPDFDKYPSAKHIEHFYQDTLMPGDCIYVPAFYFYQIAGWAETQ